MTEVFLVASPNARYADALAEAIGRATNVVLVTGFASTTGVEWLAKALDTVFAHPEGQARITVAVDRRGFNASGVFEALLAIKKRVNHRLELGIVLEEQGLMHAKALFARGGPRGTELIVGSANLTQSAFDANQELGIHLCDVPKAVESAFFAFHNRLQQKSLDGHDAKAFLRAHGLLRPPSRDPIGSSARSPSALGAVARVLAGMAPLPPLQDTSEHYIEGWIKSGYLVGKGRRGADALVVRLPMDQLRKEKILATSGDLSLGQAAKESRRVGYSIDLLPSKEAKKLRTEIRRVSLLLTKLSLSLPCFGTWMPHAYWELFGTARQQMLASATLSHQHVTALAKQQRDYLLEYGGLRESLDQVLERLRKGGWIMANREPDFLLICEQYVREVLDRRLPGLLADGLEFRTARQQWSPYDQTDQPYRQLMVDIIQATFSSTYETGAWPKSSPSFAVRALGASIASVLRARGETPDGIAAQETLDIASRWDTDDRPFDEVVAEFRRLIPDEPQFPVPDLKDLLAKVAEEGADDEDT